MASACFYSAKLQGFLLTQTPQTAILPQHMPAEQFSYYFSNIETALTEKIVPC